MDCRSASNGGPNGGRRPTAKRSTVFASTHPVAWIVLLSLIWAIAVAFDLVPILRGPATWTWGYSPVLAPYRIWPLILGMILYLPVGLWLRPQHDTVRFLAWAFLGGIGLTLATVHVRGDVIYLLSAITVSGAPTGWHMAAGRILDLSSTLRNWPEFMSTSAAISAHMDHTPPGFVIMYYAASHLLDQYPQIADWLAQPVRALLSEQLPGYTSGQYASAWLGMIMPIWGSMTVVPLYFLGRRILGHTAASWVTLWWPLVPGFLLFAPLPNTAYAFSALLVIWLLWHGLSEDRIGWVFAAGTTLSVLTFFTFTFVPLLFFAGLLTLGAFWLRGKGEPPQRRSWLWPISMGLGFGTGLCVVWLIFYVATGSGFLAIWQTVQQTQADIAALRPYLPWLGFNLNDFFMFAGWPVAFLGIFGSWLVTRNLFSGRQLKEGDVMILAATATILVSDLYGTPRGEWGRIMLFLTPWLLYAAATALRGGSASGRWLTVAQGVIVIVMAVCLRVMPTGFR